ncbi:MAG: hypothetical protein LBJ96_03070 [Holosporaceae bacterium]|jgi:hypothetical protein|nr:hypothetical protein [Holosporaceae bacterium]
MKEFHAWERKSKHPSAGIFEAATAENSKKFLTNLHKKDPFMLEWAIEISGKKRSDGRQGEIWRTVSSKKQFSY